MEQQIERCLALCRLVDQRAVECLARGEIPFYLPVAGREATGVGGAAGIEPADWIFPGYHSLGAALWRGVPLERNVGRILGTAADPGLGRELPGFHFSRAARIAPATPNLGAHLTQAYGAALAIRHRGAREVVLACCGSASAATSAFAQATRRAAEQRLPLLVLLETPDGEPCGAVQVAARVREAAAAARDGGGARVIELRQADDAFDGVRIDENLVAEVQAAFDAARRAGPPPAASLFDHVTVQRNPALQRQARWFLAPEARDAR